VSIPEFLDDFRVLIADPGYSSFRDFSFSVMSDQMTLLWNILGIPALFLLPFPSFWFFVDVWMIGYYVVFSNTLRITVVFAAPASFLCLPALFM